MRNLLIREATEVAKPNSYRGQRTFIRPDGTVFGLRESREHGLTIDILRSHDPNVPNGFKVHRK